MKAANEELEAAIAVAGGSAEFQVDAVSDEETEHIVMVSVCPRCLPSLDPDVCACRM